MAEAPTSAVYLLKRAELAVRGCVEVAFSEVALTPSQYYILFLVKRAEATSSAELARAMGVLPQSMTELIAPLEKRGAIVRRPDSSNNRILRIELTSAGLRLFERGTERAIRFERELLDGFGGEELGHLCRGLSALIARAEKHSYHPKLRRLHKNADKPKVARAARKKTPRQRAGGR
ncbi:MAG TPA: MarR family transcriptional regulator [Gammaproteobacteria bacterium]|nr:MarR family transcriptional regulator [Gammaproteobacteria bacterium]